MSPAVCSSASQPSPGDPGQARQETNTQALRLMARTLGDLSCPQDWPRCRYTGAHKCSAYVETEAQRGFTTCPRAHSQAGLTPNIPSHSSSGVGWVLGRWAPGPPARSPPSLGIQSHWCRPAAAALSQFTRKPSREGSSRLCSERPQERLLLAGLMILPPPTAGSPSLPEGCPGLGLAGGEGRENLWDRGWVLGVQRGTQPCFVFISPSLT